MKGKHTKNNISIKQTEAVRPPIVVVLGHVDHGKSSILEAIREDFAITSKESGGITQHIGAYKADVQGKEISFIDTPGHEAFSAMRSRGATVADIALLVVAADDGVKEQTKEAIQQIKQAELPMIVVVNKIDKPEANTEKVKQELSQHEVFVESFGGKVPIVEVSALTKQGITELLEMILLVAEMEDLRAHMQGLGSGVIIESFVDTKRGVTATILVTNGTISVGDIIGTHSAMGKVRMLESAQGASLERALPSTPAIVLGFESIPGVGEKFAVFESEEAARANMRADTVQSSDTANGEDVCNIIVKADVHGSLEAVCALLGQVPAARIVRADVGMITESDVRLAQGTKSSIFGLHVVPDKDAASFAEREHIPIEVFNVIYELVDRVKEVSHISKEPEFVQKDLGTMEILAIFRTEKSSQIVGGKITQGEIKKGSSIEIQRKGELVGKGKVKGIKRGQTEADRVLAGEEVGVQIEGTDKIQEGDILQIHEQEIITG